MKKIALIALAASAAAIATPAAAQSASGTVNLTGSVAAKCTAQTPITGTITLNELAGADGKVLAGFGNATGGLSRSFHVVCTSAAPSLTVSATALDNTTDATTGGGYTGRVQYTATLTAQKAGGGSTSIVYTTADTPPAATTAPVGDRLLNAAGNITVAVSNGATTNATDLLKSGAYTTNGVITITVSPT